MKTATLIAVLLAATSLAACEKTEVHPPATVIQPTVETPAAAPAPAPSTVVVPVPVQGPQGPAGDKGDKGDAGKAGDTTVIVPANNDNH